MATKLKNLRMTSVDLVRNGANQAADICLYKSADPTEDPTTPTAEETNVLKRFFARLFATTTEAAVEPDDPIEKADEESCLADVYKSAITESLQSIAADETLSATEKNDMIAKSLSEYHDAMLDLFGFGSEEPLQKAADDDDLDDWEWEHDDEEYVGKANPNHDSLGRFASSPGGGGGGGLKGSDVRNFGVPGYSSSHHMNKKERKLAQTIIDNEELDLEIRDESDAYGNASTSLHGTREDYQTFKDMWQMVAPSTLGKSADIDEIEEV